MMVRYHEFLEKEEKKDHSRIIDDVVQVHKRAKQES